MTLAFDFESIQKLGVLRRELLLCSSAKARIPLPERRAERIIQDVNSDLKKQVGSTRRPAQLLLLHESLGDHLIDGRFDEAGGNALATSVSLGSRGAGAGGEELRSLAPVRHMA